MGQNVHAQFDHEPVHPDLEGSELLEALVTDFKTQTTLSLSRARDTLFASVWAIDDTLRCAYTGFPRFIDPDEDPTQTVFNDGAPDGINTEHSYPRSKGAGSGNAEADMHHLYPTRVDINSARATIPFGEVPDNEATWYYLNESTNIIPAQNIDLYTESNGESFELRENFGGNIARAAFYFYTMYRQEADDADPDFFDSMVDDLCDWHFQDPVDQEEWENTHEIAFYQEDKVNPFVLDCSLASRSYCDNISENCITVNVLDLDANDVISISPNPVREFLNLNVARDISINQLLLFDINGQMIRSFPIQDNRWDMTGLFPGVYFLNIHTEFGVYVQKLVKL